MAVPNPDPTRQTGSLQVRDEANVLLGTIAPYVDAWELVIEATSPALAVSLPAGTYRLRSLISADCATEPLRSRPAEMAETVTTIVTAGPVTIPTAYNEAIRSITSGHNVAVRFAVSVEVWNQGVGQYERYARGSTTLTVGPQLTTIGTFQLMAQRQVLDAANAHVRDPSDWDWALDEYLDAGIDWVRFAYPWSYAEELATGLTEPHATKLDAIVAKIHARGLKYQVILGAAVPCWASSRSGKDCSTLTSRNATATALAAPTAGWSQYGDFVTRFVNRFVPDAVEGDNEPNQAGYTNNGITAADEVTRMTQLWNGVKASSHPTTVVCSPALSLADTDYLTALYAAGIKSVCDVIAVHPYDAVLLSGRIVTASASTDLLTSLTVPHGYKQNERVVINGASLPAPLAAGTPYYVRDVTNSTFGLALTPGGARINLTSNGAGTITVGWTFRQADPRVAGSPFDAARMEGSLVQGTHRIHKIMRANGDGTKPIWISEWGLTTSSTFILPLDDATKGEYIDAAMRLAAHMPYLEVMGLYTLIDPAGTSSSGLGFGSITQDRVRKGSYARLKSVLAAL